MGVGKVIAELVATVGAGNIIEKIGKTYGAIYKSADVEINGVKGFLIWDYIIYNEITFRDMDGNIISLFTSMSDEKTEEKWDELMKKFNK